MIKLLPVRQKFPVSPRADLSLEAVGAQLRPHLSRLKPNSRVAVAVGSRGITNLAEIVFAVLENLRRAGAQPFIIPAMGSHGGATPEGQTELLASYGVTEAAMRAPIRASMETSQVGASADHSPVHCSVEALSADAIILINRIKPHTDFFGKLGSGLIKMSVIGLGKRDGATAMHIAASRLGHEQVIRNMARVLLDRTPILCGVAIVEDAFHQTARVEVVPSGQLFAREEILLEEARTLMPRLPFEEIDLLIIDRIGKNISGAGMDPNVTNRWVNGYSTALSREGRPAPFIKRIFVRDLTPETHGNAIGIGFADITTTRLVRAIDLQATYINALTALTPAAAKIPIHFEADREAIDRAIASLALAEGESPRIVRIQDTLSLEHLLITENLFTPALQPTGPALTLHDMGS